MKRKKTASTLAALAIALTASAGGAIAGDKSTGEAAPGKEQSSWLMLDTASVLPKGKVEVGVYENNYDRVPLGIDVVDIGPSAKAGIGLRSEVYFSYEAIRSVSVPGASPVPAPPLDIVVFNNQVPRNPYRPMYWPMPFLEHYPARVDDYIPGEFNVGVSTRLFGQQGARPAVKSSVGLFIPSTENKYKLEKGSGSGSVDFDLGTAAQWELGRVSVAANAGMRIFTKLNPSDMLIIADQENAKPEAISRPHMLSLGAGVRYDIFNNRSFGLAMIGEYSKFAYVGGHTSMQLSGGANDILGGVQIRFKKVTFTAGVRQHLTEVPDKEDLPTGDLAGAIDLSGMSVFERGEFLNSIGVYGSRPFANVVVTGLPPGTAIPDGAKVISPTYKTATHGNTGTLFRLSVRF